VENLSPFKFVKWLRVHDVPELVKDGKCYIFEDEIEPKDIKQGQLGDCYFLTSLGSLAEWPDRVRKLFITDQVNKYGIYGLRMFYNGKRVEVVVDDLIPCTRKAKPKFSRANGPELWVIILEKAWAKIHGCYERISAGNTYLTIRDLTGAPGYYWLEINDQMWNKIIEFDKNQYPMSCGIHDGNEEEMKKIGLVANHAYSLISACTVNSNGKSIRLVKLRNPWGDHEWQGDWSDKSKLWTADIRQQIKGQNIHMEEAANDGIFWMSFVDFKNIFNDFDMNKYVDGFKFSNVMLKANDTGYHLVKMTIQEKGMHTVALTQYCERMMPRGSAYTYSLVRIIVFQADDDRNLLKKCRFIKGTGGSRRDEYIDFAELEKGDYFVFAQIDWN